MRMRHARGKREAHRRDRFQAFNDLCYQFERGDGRALFRKRPARALPAAAYKYNTAQQDASQPFIFQARDRPGA